MARKPKDDTKRRELALRALDMCIDGTKAPSIAAACGYEDAYEALEEIKWVRYALVREGKQSHRDMLRKELDALLEPLRVKIQKGVIGAVDAALKVIATQAKLYGLQVPVAIPIEHTGRNGGPIELDLTTLSDAELARLADGGAAPVAPSEGGDGAAAEVAGPQRETG